MLMTNHDTQAGASDQEAQGGAIPPRDQLINASEAARLHGISYATLRMYWVTGARGFKLKSWREGSQRILLLRSEVDELKRRLTGITPNIAEDRPER